MRFFCRAQTRRVLSKSERVFFSWTWQPWQAASQRWRVASNDSVGGLLTLGQPASGGHHVPSHSRHPGDQSRVEAEARGASRPPSRGHQAEAAALLLISSTTSPPPPPPPPPPPRLSTSLPHILPCLPIGGAPLIVLLKTLISAPRQKVTTGDTCRDSSHF